MHRSCFTDWFGVTADAEIVSLVRQVSAPSGDLSLGAQSNSSFFQGRFKKYSAELGEESYILKMREKDAPELPEVEYLCNQIGQRLGIAVAAHYMIDLFGDRVFVTKNFIKKNSPTNLHHIYHFCPDDKHDCATLIDVISRKTGKPRDVAVFVDTLLFDALIGNHDRHGRNLAFIQTTDATTLAPIYDNVSCLGLEHGPLLQAHFNPLGKIATSQNLEPSMMDYIKELKSLGYESQIRQFIRKANMQRIQGLIEQSFCSDLMKDALKRLILRKYQELVDAIDAK